MPCGQPSTFTNVDARFIAVLFRAPLGPNENPENQGLAGQLSGLATDPTARRFGANARRQSGWAENSSAILSRGLTLMAKAGQ